MLHKTPLYKLAAGDSCQDDVQMTVVKLTCRGPIFGSFVNQKEIPHKIVMDSRLTGINCWDLRKKSTDIVESHTQ